MFDLGIACNFNRKFSKEIFTSHLQLLKLSLIPLFLDNLPNNLYSHTFILEYKK